MRKNVLSRCVALLMAACCLFVSGRARGEAVEQLGYETKMLWLRGMLAGEKLWIKTNQGEQGELYVNGGMGESGSVNPYFACQAAMGLLAGEPSRDDLDCVGRYLTWHTARLIESQGEICNYRAQNGQLVSTKSQDSVDGYVAVYLTLLGEYVRAGGELMEVPQAMEAVDLCARLLENLMKNGLTKVSRRNATRYLMDNAEVLEACRSMTLFLDGQGAEGLRGIFQRLAEEIAATMEKMLWDANAGRYATCLDSSGRMVRFSGWKRFYPDAMVQLYPVSCGLNEEHAERNEALYRAFCDAYAWENMELGDAHFPWARIAYVAAKQGDVERVEKYMLCYQTRYALNRSYPLHTAEAGWFARSCALLLDHYESLHNDEWLRELLDRLKGEAYES